MLFNVFDNNIGGTTRPKERVDGGLSNNQDICSTSGAAQRAHNSINTEFISSTSVYWAAAAAAAAVFFFSESEPHDPMTGSVGFMQ